MILIATVTLPVFLDMNVFLLGLTLVTLELYVFSKRLHGYTEAFSVHHFPNLTLESNIIPFCPCSISCSVFQIALKSGRNCLSKREWEILLEKEFFNLVVGLLRSSDFDQSNLFSRLKTTFCKNPISGE